MKILVQFDYFPIVRDVAEEEVEEHSREFIARINSTVKPRSKILTGEVKKRREKTILSKPALEWLSNMARKPYLSIVERTKAMAITNHVANRIKRELLTKGFVRKVSVCTGRPGAPRILLEFTKRAVDYMNLIGEKITRKGRGGIKHQYWQNAVKEFWRNRGLEVMVEPNIEGANTDVLVIHKSGKRTAIEIALSIENQIRNIERDLEYFDEIIVATETRSLMMKIKDEASKCFEKEELQKVKFKILGDYLT